MLHTILDAPLSAWMKAEGNEIHSDVVLSSRIRLARNMKDLLFPSLEDERSLEVVDTMMRSSLEALREACGKSFSKISLQSLSTLEKEVLVEKHLISPALSEKTQYRSFIVSEDGNVSIMINEEDHLRIQTMECGLNLRAAYDAATMIDDVIEATYDYAFSETYGYMTACPTNVGTGLRASVMVHLPGLAMSGKLKRIIRSIIQLGYSVRGMYGEGSEGLGHIYQISNQRTMGISEEETLSQLEKVVKGLIWEEEKSRKQLQEGDAKGLEDRIWRAYGVLRYARSLDSAEALTLLSHVELGRILGILPVNKPYMFKELLVITRPNFLGKYVGRPELSPEERDVVRADVLRDTLE